jgi:hypothetical protein
VDVVVFSAPQLSLLEMQMLANRLDGRRTTKPLLAITSPQIKPDADRMGLTARIEASGATVLSGMCFYQSYAGDGRGERMAAPRNELGETNKHSGRLRLRTGPAVDGPMHRRRLLGMHTMIYPATASIGRAVRGRALVATDGF